MVVIPPELIKLLETKPRYDFSAVAPPEFGVIDVDIFTRATTYRNLGYSIRWLAYPDVFEAHKLYRGHIFRAFVVRNPADPKTVKELTFLIVRLF